MTLTILLAPSADLARGVLAASPVVLTVEAEYGSYVAEGTAYTAAHHQPAGSPFAGRHVTDDGRPSPCNDTDIPAITEGVILVSHVDLDTFGGCLRALGGFEDLFPSTGERPTGASANKDIADWITHTMQVVNFWNLAEYVDVRGPHKLGQAQTSLRAISQLYAFWAWSKAATPRFSRDQVTDVTATVQKAGEALRRIFADDAELLAAGQTYREDEEDLNRRTFLRNEGAVIVRIAGFGRDFCNHLYVDPDGKTAPAVACYNRENGSVTISLADPVSGVSCRTILQDLWGPEAGGHDGIAGSPREKDMGEEGLQAAVESLLRALTT